MSLLPFDGPNGEAARFLVIEALPNEDVPATTTLRYLTRDEVKGDSVVMTAAYEAFTSHAPRVVGSFVHHADIGEWLRIAGRSKHVVIVRSESAQEVPYFEQPST